MTTDSSQNQNTPATQTATDTRPASILSPPSAYDIRDELTDMVIRDLLGPAGGPNEELDQREDRVRERYLVGTLAPRAVSVEAEELDQLGSAEPDDVEVGMTDILAPTRNTMLPSSIGMSFVVDPVATAVLIKTEWGRYSRMQSDIQKRKDGSLATSWKRQHINGKPQLILLRDGMIKPVSPWPDQPLVVIQGRIRKTRDGWIVTVFLVNQQEEQKKLKDEVWVFQPRITVLDPDGRAIFIQRRSLATDLGKLDPLTREEIETLDMIYRHRLEFAAGHGVSVHVTLPEPNAERATLIETAFIPLAEVAQQVPPTPQDDGFASLAGLVRDMKVLAEMPKADLVANLRIMEGAYGDWIVREAAKLADPAEGLERHREAVGKTLERCQRMRERIKEGIDVIENDSRAEEAFRFSNRAMWLQRIRSTYARRVRKKEMAPEEGLGGIDVSDNRSWHLFQIAFILLNLPSVTDLHHPDRSHETDAVADLLWFATAGGKTEAYLGLTAYVLALRRLQGDIEGRPGDHGVAVLMRYTLRLLTLQQFQRAAALLCACEAIRRGDTGKWGTVPFRLGLWVGNKMTPNTLKQAAEALRQTRLGGPPSAFGSPYQMTSCP